MKTVEELMKSQVIGVMCSKCDDGYWDIRPAKYIQCKREDLLKEALQSYIDGTFVCPVCRGIAK